MAATLLRNLIVLFVAVVAALFALAAWQEHRDVSEAAAGDLQDAARLLEEHAQKVIGSGAVAKAREIAWLVSVFGWERIERDTALQQHLRELIADRETESLWLVDATGQVRFNTIEHPRALNLAERDYFRWARQASGEAVYVGDLLFGRITGLPFFPVAVRIEDAAGAFMGTVQVSLRPDYFHEVYSRTRGAIKLVTQTGSVLARDPPLPPRTALTLPADFMARLSDVAGAGMFTARAPFEDVERLYAWRRVEGLPLFILIGYDTAAIAARWGQEMLLDALFALPAVLLLLGLGLVAWRRTREVEQAKATLERRVDERTAALQQALEQRNLLLREVNHRVKNTLQLVASLLQLQMSKGAPALRGAFADAIVRIGTIARLHRHLYGADRYDDVEVAAFLEELCMALAEAYAGERPGNRIACEAAPATLPTDIAVPLSLIVNELVTNAFKHARRAEGVLVRVRFEARGGGEFRLGVADNGGGLPAGFDAAAQKSLGLVLVRSLVTQIGGRLEVRNEGEGALFAVTFEVGAPAPDARAAPEPAVA